MCKTKGSSSSLSFIFYSLLFSSSGLYFFHNSSLSSFIPPLLCLQPLLLFFPLFLSPPQLFLFPTLFVSPLSFFCFMCSCSFLFLCCLFVLLSWTHALDPTGPEIFGLTCGFATSSFSLNSLLLQNRPTSHLVSML